jgi:hypothetical protein
VLAVFSGLAFELTAACVFTTASVSSSDVVILDIPLPLFKLAFSYGGVFGGYLANVEFRRPRLSLLTLVVSPGG